MEKISWNNRMKNGILTKSPGGEGAPICNKMKKS